MILTKRLIIKLEIIMIHWIIMDVKELFINKLVIKIVILVIRFA